MDWAQWLAIGVIGAASVIFLPMWFIGAMQEILAHRRAMKQSDADIEAIVKQIQALREELYTLRDTSTEHHMSLQAQLENLQARVRTLEEQNAPHQAGTRIF